MDADRMMLESARMSITRNLGNYKWWSRPQIAHRLFKEGYDTSFNPATYENHWLDQLLDKLVKDGRIERRKVDHSLFEDVVRYEYRIVSHSGDE